MVLLNQMWYDYLNDIYTKGSLQEKDDGDNIREIIGMHMFLRRPQDFPAISINDVDTFLSLMKKGSYDIDGYALKGQALYEYVTAWNDKDMIFLREDGFVYTYPERLYHLKTFDKTYNEPTHINQYEVMLNRLNNNRGSNRAVATLYNAGLDRLEQHIPCLNFIQGLIRGDHLLLSCMFRSNDIFNAWPSNMYLLTYLGMMMADDLNVDFTGIDYHCSSSHYYITEEPLVKKAINMR